MYSRGYVLLRCSSRGLARATPRSIKEAERWSKKNRARKSEIHRFTSLMSERCLGRKQRSRGHSRY